MRVALNHNVPVEIRALGEAIGKRIPSNDNWPCVVALTGQAGSGKSTAADYLVSKGYQRIKFAGPLKDMLRAIGLTENQIEGSYKEEPTALMSGHTPRYAMQTLGTEWGRNLMGQDFWVNLWRSRADAVVAFDGRVVVDDCRFPNEAAAVRKMGGMVINLEGRGGIAGSHSSEDGCGVPDVSVANTGSIQDLHSNLEVALGMAA